MALGGSRVRANQDKASRGSHSGDAIGKKRREQHRLGVVEFGVPQAGTRVPTLLVRPQTAEETTRAAREGRGRGMVQPWGSGRAICPTACGCRVLESRCLTTVS